jgi:hypothetical protein
MAQNSATIEYSCKTTRKEARMIDRLTAERIAYTFLNSSTWNQIGDEFCILQELTLEKEYGWVFFYNSERYLTTGDQQFYLYGNVPIVVERADGSVHPLPPYPFLEDAIVLYEQQRADRIA